MTQCLGDYDYSYPSDLIAQEPLAERNASRMLVLPKVGGPFQHRYFKELPQMLRPQDLLVVNDTSVLAVRLFAQKPTGGKVEVFLLRATAPREWSVFFSPARGLKVGMPLRLFSRTTGDALAVELRVCSVTPDDFRVSFDSEAAEREALAQHGEMPLPPYITRTAPRHEDRERYQTCFAKSPGAVAAPTAGLHFSDVTLQALRDRGVELASVTLHVGPGTFLPVKTENIDLHEMHEEYFEISESTLRALQVCQSRGGRVFAVGTTSLRALETYAASHQTKGWTRLFIRPGFKFQIVEGLLTNFHQPKSTLLMLVSAMAGRERVLSAYQEAIQNQYRLFSYGDCMLILP